MKNKPDRRLYMKSNKSDNASKNLFIQWVVSLLYAEEEVCRTSGEALPKISEGSPDITALSWIVDLPDIIALSWIIGLP